MRAIVIYKSKTGFTKRYAEWIREELKCEIAEYEEISKLDFNDFQLVIYGSRVHAGKIDSLERIKRLLDNKNCDLVVFATGATPNAEAETIENTMKNNFGDNPLPHFYMQSGLSYEKMGFADKTIMKMLSKMLSSKKEKSDVENGTATAISKSHNISDPSFITPLIDYVRKTYWN